MSSVMNPPRSYPFLSKPPPPPQKTRPLCPPPPTPTPTPARKRSSTFSAIAAWAAHVQPGSPGSPPSRRPSSPHTSSFLVIDTPSPVPKEFAVDLTNLGYTSVFVHLPQTPNTPSPALMASKPAPPTRPTPLKRLRSFSILRSRSNSTATPALPCSPTNPRSPTDPDSPKIIAASIAKRKKAVYAFAKSSKPKPKPTPKPTPSSKPKSGLPPSLASELALMQFADGGSTEANIKRLMEAQARAAAPAGTKAVTAVGDVYRDGKGGIWWDREEEMEYVHLLGGCEAGEAPEKWVSFGGEVKQGQADENDEDDREERGLAIASLATDADAYGRRGSAHSIGSLDPFNIIKPADEDAKVVKVPLVPLPLRLPPAPAPAPALPKTPTPTPTPQEPILTIPSRPRHAQHHLRASSNFFLLDLNAFSVPRTPHTPRTPAPTSSYPSSSAALRHTCTPVCPSCPSHSQQSHAHAHAHAQRRKGAARRRPAPLNIVAHVPMRGVSPDHGNEENEDARTDFLEASFTPLPVPKPVVRPAHEAEAKEVKMKVEEMEVEMVKEVKEVMVKEVEMTVSVPVKMHREAVYRVPSNLNGNGNLKGNGNGNGQESWKVLKKKASRPLLSLFGLK